MRCCGKEVPANLKPDRKTQLDDATSAFYFSRLPREERIAKTLQWACLGGMTLLESAQALLPFRDWSDLMEVATRIAPYAVKDFAVRPGKL